MSNTEHPLTPDTPTVWQLQAEIALLREIVYQMTQTMQSQAGYIERLDDLWHKHMLEAAAEDVYSAFLGKDEPAYDDLMWHDQSHTDLTLLYRTREEL